jgi:hypothetical protein
MQGGAICRYGSIDILNHFAERILNPKATKNTKGGLIVKIVYIQRMFHKIPPGKDIILKYPMG